MEKHQKNTSQRRLRATFLIGAMIFISLFMMNFASAALTDNAVAYYKLDANTGTVSLAEVNISKSLNVSASSWVTGKVNYGIGDTTTNYPANSSTALGGGTTANAYSVSFWVKSVGTVGEYHVGLTNRAGTSGTACEFAFGYYGYGIGLFSIGTIDTSDVNIDIPTNNSWYHYTIVVEEGKAGRLYRNGTWLFNSTVSPANCGLRNTTGLLQINRIKTGGYSTPKNLQFDEIYVVDRALTDAEILQLYNNNDSLPYPFLTSTSPLLTLNSPANNSIISTSSANFNTTLNMTGTNYSYQWKNITYKVWFSNGTEFNSTLITGLTGNYTSSQVNISGLTLGNYLWNAYACYGNTTLSNCNWSSNGNFSFQYRPFSLDSQTYTSSIYETSYQTFTANITTIPSIINVVAKLNYNGTLYSAITTCSSGDCYITTSFDIPLITSETANVTNYWNITVYDGTSSYSFNTLENSFVQNVTRIHLETCNATYFANSLNFTAWDEKDLTRISLFSFSGTFQTWLGTGSVYRNQSFQNTSTASYNLCIQPNITIYTDAQIRYAFNNDNSTYITRDYHFQNSTISNVTQHIYLYLLTAEDSTTFIIKVQDQKLSGVEDALVYIYRYYPEDGTYKVVQIAKTDSNGETIGFYETEIADYKHIIIKNGETLLETSPQKVVGKEVPFTLTFTVGEALDYPWEVFEDNPNIEISLGYNHTTKMVSYTYVDSTEETSLGRLLVLQLSKTNSTYTVICNTTSTESSATITCNMTAYDEGNFVAYGYIEEDVANVHPFTISDITDIMGRDGLLAGLFIILIMGFAFIWNPTAGIVGIEAGIILTNVIGLISFSPIFIFASLALAILAIIFVRS